jgi:hypothetical protein
MEEVVETQVIQEPVKVVDEVVISEPVVVEPAVCFEPTVIQDPTYDQVDEPKRSWKWLWTFLGLAAALVVGWVLSQS